MAETPNGGTSFSYSHGCPPLNPSPYIVGYGSSPSNLNAMNRNVFNMVPTNSFMPVISPVMGGNINHGTHLNLQNLSSRDTLMRTAMNHSQSNWHFEWMKNASLEHHKAPVAAKSRVIWNNELRRKFYTAIDRLGIDNCTPTKIHELLNIPGLSRERVANNLKRYRKKLRTMKEETQELPVSKKDDDLRSLKSESDAGVAKKSTDRLPQKARVGSSATRTAAKPPFDISQRNRQPLMIGSTSLRPSPSVQENKGKLSAKEIRQPSWFSSGEFYANQTNLLRQALSRVTPYGNVTVPNVEPCRDVSCMGSNVRENQYQKGDNGFQLSKNEASMEKTPRSLLRSEASTNEALLGISKPLMNRSIGFQLSTDEASMGITPRSFLHTDASTNEALLGISKPLMNISTGFQLSTNEASMEIRPTSLLPTEASTNEASMGITPRSLLHSEASTNEASKGITPRSVLHPEASMGSTSRGINFEASRGVNSSNAPENQMDTVKAPASIMISNPTQNFPAHGNREMKLSGSGASTANLDFVSPCFASATNWNSPLPDSSNNWSFINNATTQGDIFSQNFDISGVQTPITSPKWCTDPDPVESEYNQGNIFSQNFDISGVQPLITTPKWCNEPDPFELEREYGHEESNSFTGNQLNDSFSVAGDSSFSTLERPLVENTIITDRGRNADLIELVYNPPGREYGSDNSDGFTASNPNDDFAVVCESPFDTLDRSQPETLMAAAGRWDVDIFELHYSKEPDAINEEADEAMDEFSYLLDSPENSSSKTAMSSRAAEP